MAIPRANSAEANTWDIVAMNRLIDQTNFIVDDKCSGTLISVQHRLVLTNFHCVEDKNCLAEVFDRAATGHEACKADKAKKKDEAK